MNINTIIPFEVIDHVFSFLKISDLWVCRLVCKNWNEIIRNKKLMLDNTDITLQRQTMVDLVFHLGTQRVTALQTIRSTYM